MVEEPIGVPYQGEASELAPLQKEVSSALIDNTAQDGDLCDHLRQKIAQWS